MKTLYERVRARLDQMDPVLSDRAASMKATNNRNPDLLRALKRGRAYSPRGENLTGLAKLLGMSVEWILSEEEPVDHKQHSEVRSANIQIPERDSMPRDVPVMGTAAGSMNGKGAFQISPDVVDWVARPPGLASSRDIYALYIEGDSMEPRFNAGELVFVSPHKPIRVNDAVIIQEPNSNNVEPQAFIKLFLRKTETSIFTRQLNPDCNIEFIRHTGTTLHKVLTTNELFGI